MRLRQAATLAVRLVTAAELSFHHPNAGWVVEFIKDKINVAGGNLPTKCGLPAWRHSRWNTK